MKTALASLTSTLYGSNVHYVADLYTFYFPSGTVRWTSGDVAISASNLVPYSEPLLANINTKSAGIAQASFSDLGLVNGVSIPAGATDQYAYESTSLVAGTTYTISMYLKMADLSTPVLTGLSTTGDFGLVIDGTLCSTGLVVNAAGGGVYRVSARFTSANTGVRSCGVVRYATQTAKAFSATGFQVETASAPSCYVVTNGAPQTSTWIVGPTIKSDGSRVAEGFETADLKLTMDFGTGSLGGTTARLAGLYGGFDNVRVLMQRAFSTSSFGDCSAGLVVRFDGNITEVNPGSTEVELTVTSFMAKLKSKVPKRTTNWMCPYVLGDAGCGVNLATYTTGSSVAAGTTQSTVVMAGVNKAANFYQGGTLTITSGPMSGQVGSVTVSANSGSNHALTVFPPLPSVPQVGATMTVSRGCDKTRLTCTNTFANAPRFGGFTTLPVGNS